MPIDYSQHDSSQREPSTYNGTKPSTPYNTVAAAASTKQDLYSATAAGGAANSAAAGKVEESSYTTKQLMDQKANQEHYFR